MWSWKLNKNILDKTVKPASRMSIWNLWSSPTPQLVTERNTHTTVDDADVELFSKQMKEWWNPDGKMGLLHRMNLLRVPFVRDGLVTNTQKDLQPLKDKTILDVGCGGGILSEALARVGATVTGIDASKDLIAVAEAHKVIDPKIAYNQPNYIHTTIEDHVKSFANYYDGVVASEVIEHVNNQELFVKSCIHALKPGGRIFFTTPNRTKLSQFVVIFLCENVLNWIPQGAHQYEKFITPNELTFILERNNCHVETTFGMSYNPVTHKWDFTQYQQLMYALQAVKLS